VSIAVIIPSKTISNLVPCVEAVRANEPEAEIIAIDDGVDLIRRDTFNGFNERYGPTSVIDGIRPFVFAQNVNLGLRFALTSFSGTTGGQFVTDPPRHEGAVVLNDDALLQTPGGFTLLAQAAAENPEYGIIGAVTNVTGQPEQFPRGFGLREVEHFAFVCVYIPRSTIENPKIGLLDERYCLDYGCEDRDYCEAVKAAGLKVGVHDSCFVDHQSLISTFRGEPHAPLSFARNFELLKAKWGDRLNA